VKGVTQFSKRQLGKLSKLSDQACKWSTVPARPFYDADPSKAETNSRLDQYARRYRIVRLHHIKRSPAPVIRAPRRKQRKRTLFHVAERS